MNDTASQSSDILCDKCHEFSLKSFFFARPKSSKDQSPDQNWGEWGSRKFRDIQKKVHCPLCRLVCSSLDLNKSRQYLSNGDDSIYYYRIPFGTYEREPSSTQSMILDIEMEDRMDIDIDIWKQHQTNRLHVSTNPVVLGYVGPECARFLDAVEMIKEDADVDITLLEKEQTNFEDCFLQGRPVEDPLNFDICKHWLDICKTTHGESCMTVPLYKSPQRMSRVIDVKKRMVIPAPLSCSYAALSYRWGEDVEQLKLNEATFIRLTTPGGLDDEWDDIPFTISDAIALCCQLSVQFLWVDALCIRQDDPKDKTDQLNIMDAIYSCADFTIVAACGTNSWAGLPGVESDTRYVQKREVVGELTLSIAQPSLLASLEKSSWNTRAWIFQEAILSRRLLIFTEHGAFFQCNSALWWEDTHQEPPPPNASVIHNIKTPIISTPFWKRVLPSKPDFQSYAELVRDYTRRSMTEETDSLNAFSGLSHALETPFNTTFFKGLPLLFFDVALCFETPFPNEAKRINGFPSWSWCGWNVDYGVSYDTFEEKTIICCNNFYRINCNLDMGERLIPLRAESANGEFLCMKRFNDTIRPPAISYTILDSMSDVEVRNLLIFETESARLFIGTESDRNDEYTITTAPSLSASHGSKVLGTIRLDPLWRRNHAREEPFEFIIICRQYRYEHGGTLLALLVEKDHRGISQRVQMCGINVRGWIDAVPILETIYLI